jgi:fucose permease
VTVPVTSRPASRHRVAWACYGLLFLFGLSVGIPGPAVPSLQEAYGLSYAGAALHLTAFAAGSAVGSLIDDRLGQRLSRATALRVGLIGVMAGMALSALAPVGAISIAGIGIVGFSATIALNIAHGVIGSEYSNDRETVLVNAHLMASVGIASAAVVVAAARALGQWRLAFAAPALVVMVMLTYRFPHLLPPRAPEPRKANDAAPAVPAAVRIGGGVLALVVAVEWAVTFWAATYLRDPVGLPSGYADVITICVLATLVVGRVLLSRLTQHWDAAGLLRAGLLVTIVASLPYLAGPRMPAPYGFAVPIVALFVLCLLVTTLFPLALTVTLGMTGESAAEQQRTSAAALSISSIGAIVTPYMLGSVADATTLTIALVVLPVGSLLALAGLVTMRRAAAG